MLCNICLKEIKNNREIKIEEHFYPKGDEYRFTDKRFAIGLSKSYESRISGYGYSGYACEECYKEFINVAK